MFDALSAEAVEAYDRICGLNLEEVSVDGSSHKAPCGGPGTGKDGPARKRGLGGVKSLVWG